MLRSFFRNHLLSFQPEPTSSNWPRPAALLRGIWRLGCRCDPRTCRTHRLRPLGGIACAHLVECRRGQAGLRDRGVFRRTARMSSRRCAIESSPTSPGSLRLRRSPEQRVPRGELRGRDSPPALGRARRGDSGPTKRATGGTSHGAIPTASPCATSPRGRALIAPNCPSTVDRTIGRRHPSAGARTSHPADVCSTVSSPSGIRSPTA
jgi:hypothetical protein